MRHVLRGIKEAVRLCKVEDPSITVRDIEKVIFERFKRHLSTGSIHKYLHQDTPLMSGIKEKAVAKFMEKRGEVLIKTLEDYIPKIDSISFRLIKMIDEEFAVEEGRESGMRRYSVPELVRILKDLADAREKIVGVIKVSTSVSSTPENLSKLKTFEDILNNVIEEKEKIDGTRVVATVEEIRPARAFRPEENTAQQEADSGERAGESQT